MILLRYVKEGVFCTLPQTYMEGLQTPGILVTMEHY